MALAALVGTGPAFADPPAHVPAHGYYKKQQADDRRKPKQARHYQGKSGVTYVDDYGISAGRCNRDDRVVGMVVGGVLGAIVGHAIGDRMDERDRACMGHALELGRPGMPVEWRSAGHAYQFTPRGDARDGCRNATLVVDGRRPRDVLACPSARGEWRFRNI